VGIVLVPLPPINIDEELIKKIEEQTKKIALNLGVVGLMNIQFAIYTRYIYDRGKSKS